MASRSWRAPVESLEMENDRIAAMHVDGKEHRFDVLYSALGLKYRSDLALSLGAEHDPSGGLIVDSHCQTTVKGLYAAGDIVRGSTRSWSAWAMPPWPRPISTTIANCRPRTSPAARER